MKTDRQPAHEPLFPRETFFACLAHALGPIMMIVDWSNKGPQSIPFLIATAAIYLYFRDKSDFVKHHARQALALQLLGTLGWLILITAGTAIWLILLIVSVIAILVLVGLVLVPVVILSYPFFVLASLSLPLSIIVLGSIAAWQTANGHDFDYPVLARLLDRYLGVAYVRADITES
ncbi:MAG: DUF4870 domain-containing protein [Chloroflexi bacterium]|nr:DUF4870 domain-containing protein [Chloroflexota bacterium]